MNTTLASEIEYLPQSRRRLLVAVALAGYPVAVAALAGPIGPNGQPGAML